MFTPLGVMLFVLAVVAVTVFVRETTELTPDDPVRVWMTRATVVILVLWFGLGALFEAKMRYQRHGIFDALLSRGVSRGILAALLILVVFRDEL